MAQKDYLTLKLLRLVGSPSFGQNGEFGNQNVIELHKYAAKNRMSLLCLEALRRLDRLDGLREDYDVLRARYAEAQDAIRRASDLLNKAGTRYAFFKSIRPYKEVTVDIDILIFGSAYEEAKRTLRTAGYFLLGSGPLSTTFRDNRVKINLDVYNEVGVSSVIYLDKDVLAKSVGKTKLPNGAAVSSLTPDADLLALIAHSVIKEQMYVLSEYYTTLYYLADMKEEGLNSFLSLTDKCKMRSAVKTHLGITALLHLKAHNFVPFSLMRLIKKLDMDSLELMRVRKMGFQMPLKYHPITLLRALMEKSGEEKARRSFALQTLNMIDPGSASLVIKRVLQHVSRETY